MGQKWSQVQKRGALWWGTASEQLARELVGLRLVAVSLKVAASCHLVRVSLGIATLHHLVRASLERAWRNVPHQMYEQFGLMAPL